MDTFWITLLISLAAMTVVWLISVRLKDASIVDIFWGPGFVLIVWAAHWLSPTFSWRGMLIGVLTTIWGLRLGIFLFLRNSGKGEDPRYQTMRTRYGQRFWWVSFFIVYLLQGTLMWIVSWPTQAVQLVGHPVTFSWLDGLGLLFWVVGLVFESVGDWQLAKFKSDPVNAGRVMNQGLWRYTRHPNYFGDFLVWWGFALMALNGGWLTAWTLIGPLLMSVLLLKVSGVTLLEKRLHHSRPAYAEYARRTSAFFPRPPKV